MNKISIFIFLAFMFVGSKNVQAQIDFEHLKVNPKTFMFEDGKMTLLKALYTELEEKTQCCGNDAIYVELKFDEAGNYVSSKALTGRNECFKRSIMDILPKVHWDATVVNGTKTIYFQIKPIIPCSGQSTENVYKVVE